MNNTQREDCQSLCEREFLDWQELSETTILVTGATGLIGSNLVNAIAYANKALGLHIRLVLPVRNIAKAEELFGTDVDIFEYRLGDSIDVDGGVDYIVHLASSTSSKFFTSHPADTLLANVEGTKAMLDLAVEKHSRKFIYLSSMEVYGFPDRGHKVTEGELGGFETMAPRNSYPIAKLASESLCEAYFAQYAVPAVVLRATQTFGPGVRYEDRRVFAEFMRCAVEGRDIVLRSEGLTERCYLYTADAVAAIVTCMLRGVPGEAYSVANSSTYCSIKGMAEMVSEHVADGAIEVVYDLLDDVSSLGYADTLYMDLDCSKLEGLGWRPSVGLQEMYKRMIDSCAC